MGADGWLRLQVAAQASRGQGLDEATSSDTGNTCVLGVRLDLCVCEAEAVVEETICEHLPHTHGKPVNLAAGQELGNLEGNTGKQVKSVKLG